MASIARKNPYFVETLKHEDFIDLKQLKKDMGLTNVKKDEDGNTVRWNLEGSITCMCFEKGKTDTILYKVDYDADTKFKAIKVI